MVLFSSFDRGTETFFSEWKDEVKAAFSMQQQPLQVKASQQQFCIDVCVCLHVYHSSSATGVNEIIRKSELPIITHMYNNTLYEEANR